MGKVNICIYITSVFRNFVYVGNMTYLSLEQYENNKPTLVRGKDDKGLLELYISALIKSKWVIAVVQ